MEDSQRNQTRAGNSAQALSESLAGAIEKVAAVVVAVDARPRVATSGVHWRDGIIVSTNHTIRRDEEITVTTNEGRTLPATLVGRDAGTDLAVLRVEGGTDALKTSIEIGDAGALKVGNLVLAVGRTDTRGATASFGIVHAVSAEGWRTWRGGEIDRLIRLDLSIALGFSGGALVDTEGRVHGINTSALARGAGLTIPAATVNRVVDALMQRGRIARPYLGVGMYPVNLPDTLQTSLGLPSNRGLIMLSVEPGAPAAKAGMLVGDVLIALDGKPIADTDDVQAVLGTESVGQEVKASIIRGGAAMELTITVGERPQRRRQ